MAKISYGNVSRNCQDVAQEENKNVDKDDCPKEVEDTTKKMKLL